MLPDTHNANVLFLRLLRAQRRGHCATRLDYVEALAVVIGVIGIREFLIRVCKNEVFFIEYSLGWDP